MSDKRQKNQLVLAFTEEGRSEAPKASQEGTESRTAKCETERPARHERLMEEVCERKNCWQAYKRVKANKRRAVPTARGIWRTVRLCLARFPSITSPRLVYLACSLTRRNPLNRRMRTRTSWWCGRDEQATAPPMPISSDHPQGNS
jgi:hypothetical protein